MDKSQLAVLRDLAFLLLGVGLGPLLPLLADIIHRDWKG